MPTAFRPPPEKYFCPGENKAMAACVKVAQCFVLINEVYHWQHAKAHHVGLFMASACRCVWSSADGSKFGK